MEINVFKIQRKVEELRKILEDQRITGFMRSGYLDQISTLENQKTFVIQTFGVLIPLVAVLSTLVFSYIQNDRENADSQLRNRPYLIIGKTDSSEVISGQSANFGLHIKNVGIFPAQVINSSIYCPSDANVVPREEHILIGNGEEMVYNFSVSSNLSSVTCRFVINYKTAVSVLSKGTYTTQYVLRFKDDSTP